MFSKFGRNSLIFMVRKNAEAMKMFSSEAPAMNKYDHLQEEAMKENCILVDENDRPIGYSSKKDCHTVSPEGRLKLHRAFSVFLFNSKGELLVQRRSGHKITFPDRYTNSCCSHPLHDIKEERIESNALGIRRAAQRRLNYELGVPYEQAQPDSFHYVTRIQYEDIGDGTWGENEIDHILFLHKDVDLNPNPNEVSEIRFIKRENLDNEIANMRAPLTPWFRLILQYRLRLWWDNLTNINKYQDLKTIQKLR